jgi:hypothetical protein
MGSASRICSIPVGQVSTLYSTPTDRVVSADRLQFVAAACKETPSQEFMDNLWVRLAGSGYIAWLMLIVHRDRTVAADKLMDLMEAERPAKASL